MDVVVVRGVEAVEKVEKGDSKRLDSRTGMLVAWMIDFVGVVRVALPRQGNSSCRADRRNDKATIDIMVWNEKMVNNYYVRFFVSGFVFVDSCVLVRRRSP